MFRRFGPSLITAMLLIRCGGETDNTYTIDHDKPLDSGPATCAPCFDGQCGWEASECASDPGCANWLSCAQNSPVNNQGFPNLDGCPDPPTSTGRTLRDVFVGCLSQFPSCCAEGSATGGSGGLGGSGGGSAGSSTGGSDVGGAGGTAGASQTACEVDGCEACLHAVKSQEKCAQSDDFCGAAVAECMSESGPDAPPPCLSFLTAYARCAKGPNDGTCSYEVPSDEVGLTADALQCATNHCPQCTGTSDRDCLSCQLGACPDEMAAVLSSFDAQELLWCREACEQNANQSGCKQGCFSDHPQGTPVVVELYVCSQNACKAQCEI